MTEIQNNPKPSPLRTKKYWRNMALAVAAAVAITVFVTAGIFGGSHATVNGSNAGMYSPGTYSRDVLSGPIVLNPNGVYLTGFEVPDGAKNATLQGNYTAVDSTTNNTAVVLTVWSQQEFLNYFGNQNAEASYNKDLMPMPQDTLNVPLSKGNYLIMVSGGGYEKSLEAQLTLNFTIP